MLVTFEGGEGSGKSTQAKLLYDHFVAEGLDAIFVREPGSTPVAEGIRSFLLTGRSDGISPNTEALLFMAARSDLWLNVIIPALNAGKIVVSDRSQDSTVVYQGICKGVDRTLIDNIFRSFAGDVIPRRTYLFDIDPLVGIARSLSRAGNKETIFEDMGLEYHRKVRFGFLDLAQKNPGRFVVLDGELSVTELYDRIVADIGALIAQRLPQGLQELTTASS
ncbi:MAG: dTMP kinase [Holosporales bacterium]|nr:dTMP kinase [Holosporales bacterium]